MPRYEYRCDDCNRDYTEIRDVEHPQTYTHCECGKEFVQTNI
jgi:putative FmdB family regulatory protein